MVKKDSLIRGTIILAAAALTARFLGVFQRVPLDYMMGDAGNSYFSVANSVYLWLLTIATAGIPSAVSKMVSERYALGRPDEAQRIYRAALLFGASAGILMSTLLYAFAPFFSEVIAKVPGADAAVRAIAPALLLFPVIAMMRGYFQGRQIMSAGGISQIIEQVMRVVVGVGLALVVLNLGWGDRWVAAAATFGSVFGSIGAFFVMVWYALKLRRQDAADPPLRRTRPGGKPLRLSAIYREIFRISVPVVVTAMTVQLLYMIDTSLFIRLTGSFYTPAEAQSALGWLGFRAQTIAGIPPILAIALSQSIIPVLSAAYSTGRMAEVQRQTSLVMRIVVFTGVPAALVLTVAAHSVTGLLFDGPGGSGLVAALTAGTIFQITMMTTNSILFGMSKPYHPMVYTFVGIAVKIIASLALAPLLGAYGLVLASTLCFLTITYLNLRMIRREVELKVLGSRWGAYLATIAVSALAGWGMDDLVRSLLVSWPDKLAFFAGCAATGVTVGGLYLVLLIRLGVVTAGEIGGFPGPLRKLFSALIRRIGPKEQRRRLGN
ncbi:membrane protein [Paenibacillus sp. 32O-W]|uniref:putative polysaccharide biosynthesis protein n=1 Tax=Paenibacillus sp. 32O-W TaxID=1695218 RepID=UPI000722DAA4|nr:polysaccharide biosynthesis protein [Paenibacillus sp. 32O-W]ALS26751.1 membrane protein [Paenibacillus sp. 32O-W]